MKAKEILKWLENNMESVNYIDNHFATCKLVFRTYGGLEVIYGTSIKDCIEAVAEDMQ